MHTPILKMHFPYHFSLFYFAYIVCLFSTFSCLEYYYQLVPKTETPLKYYNLACYKKITDSSYTNIYTLNYKLSKEKIAYNSEISTQKFYGFLGIYRILRLAFFRQPIMSQIYFLRLLVLLTHPRTSVTSTRIAAQRIPGI
jgi:hypothetical protein